MSLQIYKNLYKSMKFGFNYMIANLQTTYNLPIIQFFLLNKIYFKMLSQCCIF